MSSIIEPWKTLFFCKLNRSNQSYTLIRIQRTSKAFINSYRLMSQWNFDFLREKRERKTLVSENSQGIYIYRKAYHWNHFLIHPDIWIGYRDMS